MKIVLLEDVKGLGKKGDIVNARRVWQQALEHPIDPALMGFVQLKLQALPEETQQQKQ